MECFQRVAEIFPIIEICILLPQLKSIRAIFPTKHIQVTKVCKLKYWKEEYNTDHNGLQKDSNICRNPVVVKKTGRGVIWVEKRFNNFFSSLKKIQIGLY